MDNSISIEQNEKKCFDDNFNSDVQYDAENLGLLTCAKLDKAAYK